MRDRLIALCDALGVSQAQFCKAVGIDGSFIRKTTYSISSKKMAAIVAAFPAVNVQYLLAGVGAPLLTAGGQTEDGGGQDGAAVDSPAGNDVALRIRQIVEGRGGNASRFARDAGIKPSTLNACLGTLSEPRASLLQGVLRAAPDVSARWLLLGEGNTTEATMTVSNSQGVTQSGNVTVGSDNARIAELESQLKALLALIASKQ